MADEQTLTITAEGLRENDPKMYAAIQAEGAEAERKRIQEIESLNVPGSEALVAANKFNPAMTRDKIAGLILREQETRRKAAAEKIAQDAAALATQTTGLAGAAGIPSEGDNAETERKTLSSGIAAGMDKKRGIKKQ